mmetsp:Transcript_104822/g.303386  ORF Transcript_104822/g.303386 Transcript_104822/m.303386 type:complete len:379 (+) Transcript_104822:172-1308(+)
MASTDEGDPSARPSVLASLRGLGARAFGGGDDKSPSPTPRITPPVSARAPPPPELSPGGLRPTSSGGAAMAVGLSGALSAGTTPSRKVRQPAPLPRPMVSLIVAPMFTFAATSLSFAILLQAMPLPAMLGTMSFLVALPYSLPSAQIKAGAVAAGALMPVAIGLLGLVGGALTGIYAHELYIRPFFAAALGQTYHNVLASAPGDAYRDAGELHFAKSSSVRVEAAIGYRARPTYCVAPIMDDGGAGGVPGQPVGLPQGRAATFWAVGIDCCGTRGEFSCGGSGSGITAVRAAPDGIFEHRTKEFLKAIKQACAIGDLVAADSDPILVHILDNPSANRSRMLLLGIGVLFAGAGVFLATSAMAYALSVASRGLSGGGRG